MFVVARVLITTTALIVHLTLTTTIATTAHVTLTKAAVRDMTRQTALEATTATHRRQAIPTILAHAEARIAHTMAIVLTQVDALAVVRIRQETLVQILIRQVHVVVPPVAMVKRAAVAVANAHRTTAIPTIIQTIIAGTTATAVVRAAGTTAERLVVAALVAGVAVAHLVEAHHRRAVAQAVRQVRVHAVHASH